jgi:drug/metabolite transporter (DMT)-like permease
MKQTPSTSAAPDPPRHAASAYAVLLVMVVIWGVNFPIAKAALGELDPLAFNALRFPLAAATVLLALWFRGGAAWPAPEHRMRVLGLGILGNFFYQQFFIFGLSLTRAGTASVLLAATPILTALLSAASGHERVHARTWIGVVATFVGIALVVLLGAPPGEGGHSLLGDLLMVGASLSWAIYTVGSRDLINRYGSIQFTAWTLCVGTIGLCLIGLPAVLATDLRGVSVSAWVGVFYAGAFSVGVAYLLWYHGVRQIGNTRTSAYSNLVPLVALATAWLHLGEQPLPGQIAGAAVIIGGVTLAQTRRTRTGVPGVAPPRGPAEAVEKTP